MKRILILVALILFLCSTANAFQGGGGESTKKGSSKKKEVTKKRTSGATSDNTSPPKPPTSPVPMRTPAPPLVPANGELRYRVPDGWVTEHPSSSTRAAQYTLPKAAGDPEDAPLVLYYFGQTQGGSIEANVDRWINQMQQPDGHPSKERARIETITVNGLKVTTVNVGGTYVAQMSPGSDEPRHDTNYRLRAAVVETPKGNYYAKLVGPEKTISRWGQSFMDWLKSFEFK